MVYFRNLANGPLCAMKDSLFAVPLTLFYIKRQRTGNTEKGRERKPEREREEEMEWTRKRENEREKEVIRKKRAGEKEKEKNKVMYRE